MRAARAATSAPSQAPLWNDPGVRTRDLPSAARLLAGVAILALAATASAPPPAEATRKCAGAAARDRERPCVNRTRAVVPKPDDVTRVSLSYCAPMRRQREPEVCTFGTRSARAKAHVALIGDSHALHWRTAFDRVARVKRWHAYSITAPACFYGEAVFALPAGLREACAPWYRSVARWLAAHREVSTVFVSQNAPTPVTLAAGQTAAGVKSAGFQRAWKALPSSVRNVVVVRDTPRLASDTFACVRRVMAAGTQRAGMACAVPRSRALIGDPAVAAVRALRARRYRVVDMTDFFCGSRLCYPVIGGVLVHRDADHINAAYARTLAPYLLRAIRRMSARW